MNDDVTRYDLLRAIERLETTRALMEKLRIEACWVVSEVMPMVYTSMEFEQTGTKELALEIIFKCIDIGIKDTLMKELFEGMKSKNPKIVAGSVVVFTAILREFGMEIVNPQPFIDELPALLVDGDRTVREEVAKCVAEVFKRVGFTSRPQLQSPEPSLISALARTEVPDALPERYSQFQQQKQTERACEPAEKQAISGSSRVGTGGCSCKILDCKDNRCGCRKNGGTCNHNCKCNKVTCLNSESAFADMLRLMEAPVMPTAGVTNRPTLISPTSRTDGCSCSITNCRDNRCGCRKNGSTCNHNCKCNKVTCLNIESTSADMLRRMEEKNVMPTAGVTNRPNLISPFDRPRGCSCAITNCRDNRCGCRKNGGTCNNNCKCNKLICPTIVSTSAVNFERMAPLMTIASGPRWPVSISPHGRTGGCSCKVTHCKDNRCGCRKNGGSCNDNCKCDKSACSN